MISFSIIKKKYTKNNNHIIEVICIFFQINQLNYTATAAIPAIPPAAFPAPPAPPAAVEAPAPPALKKISYRLILTSF